MSRLNCNKYDAYLGMALWPYTLTVLLNQPVLLSQAEQDTTPVEGQILFSHSSFYMIFFFT